MTLLSLLLVLAQLHVPGTHDTLQAALDSAKANDVVIVHGGVHGAVSIQRPLTLLGDPAPVLVGSRELGGYTEALFISGPFSGTVRLVNIRFGGRAGGTQYPITKPAIYGNGLWASTLVLEGCDVRAAAWRPPFPWGEDELVSAPALLTDATLVVLERCTLQASAARTAGMAGTWAVEASMSTVLVIDSVVIGGDGGSGGDERQGRMGVGGGAIKCATLRVSSSRLEVGDGPPAQRVQVVRAGDQGKLEPVLRLSEPSRMGGALELEILATGWVEVVVASELRVPVQVRVAGEWWLASPLVGTWLRRGPSTLSWAIPPDAGLIGRSYAFQAIELGPRTLSSPLTATVLP
jgi:hypothetical protein